MKSYDYIIQEAFYGIDINVYVSEFWSDDGIQSAYISCPGYNFIPKMLGYQMDESKDNVRLVVDDVHNTIFNCFEIAEKCICEKLGKEHDGFFAGRYFKFIMEYKGEKIVVDFCVDRRFGRFWIKCPFNKQVKVISIDNDDYRKAIIEEIEKYKKYLDNDSSFSVLNGLDDVKKKG